MSEQKQITSAMVVQANQLLQQIVEAGEVTPEISSRLAHVEMTGPERVDLGVYLLERVKAEKAFWKARADFFSKIAKSFDLVEDKIKEGVKIQMFETGVEDLFGVDMRFKLSRIEDRLEIEAEKIPESYKIQVVSQKVDDSRLRMELKAGKTIPGAMLIPNFRLASYANNKQKAVAVK